MSSNICQNCGKENELDFKFCAFCGEKLPHLVCIECGEEYNKDYAFCGKCGGKLVEKSINFHDSKIFEDVNDQEGSGFSDDVNVHSDSEIFHLRFKNKYFANGVQTPNGFVLLKGARIREDVLESASPYIKNSREKNKSKIKNFITTEDILFKSSSGAASFVTGSSVSGPKIWGIKEKNINQKPSSTIENNYSLNNSQNFYLKSDEYYGEGSYDGEIFTLFKGAKLNKFLAPYAEKQVIKLRKKNRSKIKNFITTDDIIFNSPSSSANFVSGTMMNGRKVWKNKNGESINDINNK